MDIIIKKIYWNRANLHIEIDKKIKEAFIFFDNLKYNLMIDEKEIVLPIYNTPEGRTLESGSWKILLDGEILKLSSDILKHLDDATRVFKYKKKYAYTVELICDKDNNLNIITNFYMTNPNPTKDNRGNKKNILYGLCNLLYRFFNLFSNEKNILLFSENESEISVNLEPLKHHLDKLDGYKIRTLTKNCFKEHVSILYRFKEIYYLGLAKVIFIDNYTPLLTYINLAHDVKLIQIWHAGIGFKSVGYARFGKEGSPHPYESAHRKNTHVIVDDKILIPVYKEVFGLSEEKFYPYGLPRLDKFLDSKLMDIKTSGLKELFPEIENKKVILFAPTYRGNGQKEAYYDMDKINKKELFKFCEENNSVILFKFHPFTNNELIIEDKYKRVLIDVNQYKSINDLLYVTDVLITDYSSCAYEASLLDIPIIFYRYDKEEYEYNRGIHTADVFKSETFEVKDDKELVTAIYKSIKIKRKNIKNIERNSCEKIIKEIFGE